MPAIPYPVLHCPTRADRVAAIPRLYDARIHIAGRRVCRQLSDMWEDTWGASHHYVRYDIGYQGVIMMTKAQLSADLTIVNSPIHFIAYVRRHKLPLKS